MALSLAGGKTATEVHEEDEEEGEKKGRGQDGVEGVGRRGAEE